MRPVISYDDITLPYDSESSTQPEVRVPSPRPPPSKKRKRSNQKSKPHAAPSSQIATTSASHMDDDEESRELTQDEIWDDSALIEAWNAAQEEYEAYNGADKGWKKEPVHKSPLWYNVPASQAEVGEQMALTTEEGEINPDSQPQNFDTFVPSHDPSLNLPIPPGPGALPGPDYSAHYLPHPPGPMVSQDEAFTRALGAMYWGGYWTAMYHCQTSLGRSSQPEEDGEGEEQDDDEPEENDEEMGEDTFVSTQR